MPVEMSQMLEMLQNDLISDGPWPDRDTMIISPVAHAMLKATLDWCGRDRRRIKREVGKAMRKAAEIKKR